MFDKILVFVSLIALIAFLGVVIGYVAEPDLIVVTTLILALAMHDFWISVFKPRDHSEPAPPTIPLEAMPTGVSGKPAMRKKSGTKKIARRKK